MGGLPTRRREICGVVRALNPRPIRQSDSSHPEPISSANATLWHREEGFSKPEYYLRKVCLSYDFAIDFTESFLRHRQRNDRSMNVLSVTCRSRQVRFPTCSPRDNNPPTPLFDPSITSPWHREADCLSLVFQKPSLPQRAPRRARPLQPPAPKSTSRGSTATTESGLPWQAVRQTLHLHPSPCPTQFAPTSRRRSRFSNPAAPPEFFFTSPGSTTFRPTSNTPRCRLIRQSRCWRG